MGKPILLVLLGLAVLVAGCGSSDDAATTAAAPTAVSGSDLDRDGAFWLSLTPDLRDELIVLGKARLGGERPDGAAVIQAMPAADLVAEVEKQYANESKRGTSIYVTYTGANDTLAKAGLDDALSRLEMGTP